MSLEIQRKINFWAEFPGILAGFPWGTRKVEKRKFAFDVWPLS